MAPTITRRPKDPNQIPRPANCFILFRSYKMKEMNCKDLGVTQKKLSQIIGELWEALSDQEKALWRAQARAASEEHKRKYPGYRYTPRPRRNKVQEEEEEGPKFRQACRLPDPASSRSASPSSSGDSSRASPVTPGEFEGMAQSLPFMAVRSQALCLPSYLLTYTITDRAARYQRVTRGRRT